MPTRMCTYPENLVKIGPVHSEIIGLQGDRRKGNESNIDRTYRLSKSTSRVCILMADNRETGAA